MRTEWEEQFCTTEPLTYVIGRYLQVRIELNRRTPSWYQRIVWWCREVTKLKQFRNKSGALYSRKKMDWGNTVSHKQQGILPEGIWATVSFIGYWSQQCGDRTWFAGVAELTLFRKIKE